MINKFVKPLTNDDRCSRSNDALLMYIRTYQCQCGYNTLFIEIESAQYVINYSINYYAIRKLFNTIPLFVSKENGLILCT